MKLHIFQRYHRDHILDSCVFILARKEKKDTLKAIAYSPETHHGGKSRQMSLLIVTGDLMCKTVQEVICNPKHTCIHFKLCNEN